MLTIDLGDTVALVLGGSRGIGWAITETFARAGATVVFTHTGNPQYAERLAENLDRLRRHGLAVDAVEADACRSADTDRTMRAVVQRYGRCDVLVANVGRNQARPVEQTTDEDWRLFLDVNLSSAFYGVRAALPTMLEKGRGKILLIGSSAAFDGGGGAADYAAAKAALTGMMRHLARSYARKGILANVIHPAVIETDLLRERYAQPEQKQMLAAQVPVGRLGRPEDIAGLAAFLASSWGDFICGQEFLVDGGRTFFRLA
jgi:3-oxoacyl-[acyl-carrier protein] reductase